MNMLYLQRVIFHLRAESQCEKKSKICSHPEITWSLFALYPVWLQSLVITVRGYVSPRSLSLYLVYCPAAQGGGIKEVCK